MVNDYASDLYLGTDDAIMFGIDTEGDVTIDSLGGSGHSTVYVTNDGTLTTAAPSDRRLKENIQGLAKSLEKVMGLKPVTFSWKENDCQGMGFIAQEVEEVIPELVATNEEGNKGIYTTEMIPYMVKAMQEQQEMIEELQKQNIKLIERLERLEGE